MQLRLNRRGHPTFDGRFAASLGHLPQGTSLPVVHTNGDFFWFKPTGRTWLMQSDGTNWTPLYAHGSTTLYVNGASGSNTQNKGTGTGTAAYATVQYAIDQLPSQLGGNVTINIASGTYRELVTIRGKVFASNFTLSLVGATSDSVASTSTTSAANPVGNGVAGYGTLTKAAAGWTVNAYQNLWIEITGGTGSGQVRVIHANTATVLTIVGRWDTVPDATSTFRIFNAATRITGSDSGADTTPVRENCILVTNQRAVSLQFLRLNYATTANLSVVQYASCDCTYCDFSNSGAFGILFQDYSYSAIVDRCAVLENLYGIVVRYSATATLVTMCRIVSAAASAAAGLYVDGGVLAAVSLGYVSVTVSGAYQLQMLNVSLATTDGYMEYEGSTGAPSSHNLFVDSGSKLYAVQNQGALATQVVRNAGGWGVFCNRTGEMYDASGLTYSGNVSGTRTPTTSLAGGTS